MAFHIRDPETDTLVRALAERRGCGLTEAVKQAVSAELEREARVPSFQDRIRALQDEVMAHASTGLEADKAFYDSLYDEED